MTPVEIHHLLNRCVEACQQHVIDDDNADIARDAFILAVEWELKALDDRLVARRVREFLDVQLVVCGRPRSRHLPSTASGG